jgi:hypothetical protein
MQNEFSTPIVLFAMVFFLVGFPILLLIAVCVRISRQKRLVGLPPAVAANVLEFRMLYSIKHEQLH